MSQKLSLKQQKVIAALLVCGTWEEAAEQAGITSRTVRRWRTTPEFREALSKALDDTLGETTRHFVTLDKLAYRKLHDLMQSKDESIAVRALSTYYDQRRHYHIIASLTDRVTALEISQDEQHTVTS